MVQTQPTEALEQIAAQFMTHRAKLFAIAHRSLRSPWAADDAVQETWERLQRTDTAAIENLEAWLTTVVSRVCIDMIRRQASRREDVEEDPREAELDSGPVSPDPFEAALRADDLALAMQIVLDALGPRERLALVLHDVFALSYDDIAPIVERTPTASRQLASRARARVRRVDVDKARTTRSAAIGAFLQAARDGDFGALLQLLDPEIELRSDDEAIALAADGSEHGAPLLGGRIRGADAVARVFAGRAELARLVLLDGVPAVAYADGDTVRAVYLITFDGGRITRIDVLAHSAPLSALRAARC